MSPERIDLRTIADENIKPQEIAARRIAFSATGFSEEWINALGIQRPTLYSPQVLGEHLAGLEERGFSNPRKMIESFPAILGYAFENIDAKLRLLGRITRLYNAPYTPQQLMETQKAFFSTKIDKLVVLARVLRSFAESVDEVSLSVIKRILFSNLEDVLVAIDRTPAGKTTSLNELLKLTKTVKAEQIPKEEKKEVILQGLIEHPKIRSRYLHGYPQRRSGLEE